MNTNYCSKCAQGAQLDCAKGIDNPCVLSHLQTHMIKTLCSKLYLA